MVSPANGYYGHRRILNEFIGTPAGRPLAGVLQHGWHIGDEPQGARQGRWIRRFVWGERHIHGRNSIPIGAPLLYHPGLASLTIAPPSGSLLAMPYHAHGVDLDGAHRAYAAMLQRLRNEHSELTVCLHPIEFASPVREIYARSGFMTVTNGARNDPAFLDRFLRQIARHETVTTNRMSTGLLYAALVGRRVFVRGAFPRSADRSMARVPYEEQWRRYQGEFPMLLDGVEGSDAKRLAGRELGVPFVRSPTALARILQVRGPIRTWVSLTAHGNALSKRVAGRRFGPTDLALGRGCQTSTNLYYQGMGPNEEPDT